MLTISNLKKEYGTHLILDVPQLQFEDCLYWVKGTNGSGKSTLLKIIAGMIPFEGEVEINSVSLRKQPTPYRRLVNYVEAEPLYPSFLTGLASWPFKPISFWIFRMAKNKELSWKNFKIEYQKMAFIDSVLQVPSYGWADKEGKLIAL